MRKRLQEVEAEVGGVRLEWSKEAEELHTRVAERESRERDAKAELEKASTGLASSQALVTCRR